MLYRQSHRTSGESHATGRTMKTTDASADIHVVSKPTLMEPKKGVKMTKALYQESHNKNMESCPVRQGPKIGWQDDLPSLLKDLVVAPIRFEVFQEFEMLADHTCGLDSARKVCFSAFRHVLTALRSDDDEVFYEMPVFAQTLTSWRLLDERWLVCQACHDLQDHSVVQNRLSVSNSMPR